MGRREQREQIFKLLFRVEFNLPEDMPEQLKLFLEDEETVTYEKDAVYISEKFQKIQEKIPEIDNTINTNTVGGQGFTAIMVSWLAKFNPLTMVLTTFLIVFLKLGSGQVSTDFRIDTSVSDIVTGIILLFIIGCEFFLQYKIVSHKNGKEEG